MGATSPTMIISLQFTFKLLVNQRVETEQELNVRARFLSCTHTRSRFTIVHPTHDSVLVVPANSDPGQSEVFQEG
jgi:hypothetical protein